jgi:hypothetical protein
MNWEAVIAVTELAGLIAVVASLIYIGAQNKQANDHATAASETAWMDALNRIFDSWVTDERTIIAIRNGFGSFNDLSKSDQAIFHMKVGSLVNHGFLARQLSSKGLLDPKIPEEFRKLVIAVLSTPGGMEYWEHDAKASPDGPELLAKVRENQGKTPSWTDLLPWWSPD